MRYCHHDVFLLSIALLMSSVATGADLFASKQQKDAFLGAVAKQDDRYDPAEAMTRRPFSSPGYHTTLTGGFVHPTRDSLNYAVALLDTGDPDRRRRAEQILRKVISLQDQDPASRTYGIWSWFLEEPLDKMSPPDWNWADFCGTQLLQVALDHMDRLPSDLQTQLKDSILHAARSVKRRNVGPGYTNIALMGTYVTLVAGELFDVPELKQYGRARLQRFSDHTLHHGSFTEYNSPTYTRVAIDEISRMLCHVRDPQARKLLADLNHRAWSHLARHFHPPTRQWAGPHSRCYSTLLRSRELAYIQRATDGNVHFLDDAQTSLTAHRLRQQCPPDLYHYFTKLDRPRLEVETFSRTNSPGYDIIGTTYLHPDFAIGSVNVGDLWNQRRPLLAYWKTDAGVVAMRLRCLHDGYEYSSASIFSVQDRSDVLSAVVFATDRGDTHISLDRLKDATIKAKDLRIRLQFEGAAADIVIPAQAGIQSPMHFSSGSISGTFHVAHAVFGSHPISIETARSANTAAIDLVLYSGQERDINFAQIDRAAVVFALSLQPRENAQDRLGHVAVDEPSKGSLTARWHRPNAPSMSLTVPAKPMPTAQQRNAASARLAHANPWKDRPPSPILP